MSWTWPRCRLHLLICWLVDLLICWFVDLLICWFVDLLICWCWSCLCCVACELDLAQMSPPFVETVVVPRLIARPPLSSGLRQNQFHQKSGSPPIILLAMNSSRWLSYLRSFLVAFTLRTWASLAKALNSYLPELKNEFSVEHQSLGSWLCLVTSPVCSPSPSHPSATQRFLSLCLLITELASSHPEPYKHLSPW